MDYVLTTHEWPLSSFCVPFHSWICTSYRKIASIITNDNNNNKIPVVIFTADSQSKHNFDIIASSGSTIHQQQNEFLIISIEKSHRKPLRSMYSWGLYKSRTHELIKRNLVNVRHSSIMVRANPLYRIDKNECNVMELLQQLLGTASSGNTTGS